MPAKINRKNIPTGYQTIIRNGRHSIPADEPVVSKGTNLGFSPADLILSGLGMCKVATVRFIVGRKEWTIGNVDVELVVSVERGPGGAPSMQVSVALHMEGDLSDEQRRELIREADACYIHRMIEGEWSISGEVELVSGWLKMRRDLQLPRCRSQAELPRQVAKATPEDANEAVAAPMRHSKKAPGPECITRNEPKPRSGLRI